MNDTDTDHDGVKDCNGVRLRSCGAMGIVCEGEAQCHGVPLVFVPCIHARYTLHACYTHVWVVPNDGWVIMQCWFMGYGLEEWTPIKPKRCALKGSHAP